jgi:hypothetical protein
VKTIKLEGVAVRWLDGEPIPNTLRNMPSVTIGIDQKDSLGNKPDAKREYLFVGHVIAQCLIGLPEDSPHQKKADMIYELAKEFSMCKDITLTDSDIKLVSGIVESDKQFKVLHKGQALAVLRCAEEHND